MIIRYPSLVLALALSSTAFAGPPLTSTEDSLVTVLSQNHAFVMKLIDKLSGHPHFAQMIKERLSSENAGVPTYAGEEQREIKALSAEQIQQLLDGDGMGLAKAAELNGFPGPRHVLDLAEQLHLDNGTRDSVESGYRAMHGEAVRLGKQLIEKEEALERLFRSGSVPSGQLHRMLSDIGNLQGELRFVHLRAHVRTAGFLNDEQRAIYRKLRGYDPGK